jgi:biotin carboxyl carrier protein
MNQKIDVNKLIALSGQNEEIIFDVRNNYEYSYKKRKLNAEIIEEADGFTIFSANGVRYPVEIVSRQQNEYEILVNGVSYNFSVETPFSLKRKKMLNSLQSSTGIKKIKSPMPGKILDIMVIEGQSVNSGDALLVLEAMKMQNVITAANKGIVRRVGVLAGNTVCKNDVLIEIETV